MTTCAIHARLQSTGVLVNEQWKFIITQKCPGSHQVLKVCTSSENSVIQLRSVVSSKMHITQEYTAS